MTGWNIARMRLSQACALALACSFLINVAAVAPAVAADAPAKQAAAAPDFRALMTGTWDRYPLLGEKPDPAFPPPPAVPDPPLKPEYKAKWEAHRKAVKEAEDRGEPPFTHYVACLPDGMPAMMMGMFPMEVLQTPGQITVIQEAYNQVRRIYLDTQLPPIEDAEPGFWGHSSGHWEGDTLVVETIGVKENVRYRDAPHSDQMRIVERLKLLSPDMMQDEVTVTDPVYFTGPWQIKWVYKRKPGYKMQEYVCESNREYRDPETGGTRLQIGK